MKAKVIAPFAGRPDEEALPRTIAVGEEIGGELAESAVAQGLAEEIAADAPAKTKRKRAR